MYAQPDTWSECLWILSVALAALILTTLVWLAANGLE